MTRETFIKEYRAQFPLIYAMMKDASDVEWKAKVKMHTGIDLDSAKKLNETEIAGLRTYETELLQDLQDEVDSGNSVYDKELKELQLVEDTRESARDFQRERAMSDSWLTKHFIELLSLLLLSITGLYIFALLTHPDLVRRFDGITEFIKNTVLIMIGFWFGSSEGSKRKNDMLGDVYNDDIPNDKW